MWRYFAGGGAALATLGAGVLMFGGQARTLAQLPGRPAAPAAGRGADDAPLPDRLPEAGERTREQKRFGRYDQDRNGSVTRDEYLAPRRKAYAKLDRDGDGRLSFEEWSAKTAAKFDAADRDRSGAMSPGEFVATAPKRKARAAAKCPPAARGEGGED